jgi:hypothetical protein
MMSNFFSWLDKLFKGMMFENDTLSLTRVMSVTGYIAFIVGSIYLMINNISWDGYATFAGYTGGGGAALQFGNKLVNSKYNSVIGSYEPKEIVEEVETREGLRKKTENNVSTGTRR